MHDLLKLEDYTLSENPGEVSVEIINKGGEFSYIIKDIPAEKNLITIAVKKYMYAIGQGGNFVFSIIKNIPSGAGMGGGSSNASAALELVSGAVKREMDNELIEAASATGSDVPFFLQGGFAFVEGRGGAVSGLDYSDHCFVVLVNNGIHINTGLAYESLKKPVSDEVTDCRERKSLIREKISIKSEWKNIFRNDFEDTIFRLYPQISSIKDKMYQNGAFFALMTGSGSTVFGLFNDEYSAINVHKILEKEGNKVYLTKFRSWKN